jgi:hypothetical protein
MEGSFEDYLKQREAVLSLFHPQWDLTNEEISSSSDLLKRNGTPICIPPSWDLVQKYVGPEDKEADGISRRAPKLCKLFAGDQAEAEFHDIFRNLKIGGILVGDINSVHFLGMEKFVDDQRLSMPQKARDVFQQELNGRFSYRFHKKIFRFFSSQFPT